MPEQRRRPGPGGRTEREQKPDDDARKRDGVRQQMVLEVDREEHDHRAREQQPRNEERVGAEHDVVQHEHDHRHQLDDRIAERDRRRHERQRPRSTT